MAVPQDGLIELRKVVRKKTSNSLWVRGWRQL